MGLGSIKRFLFGKPLASHVEEDEKLNVPLGLAVFASDSLSSTAYATDEILLALVASSMAFQANMMSLPVAAAITILIGLVVISYRQIIHAYPEEGGAYVVAKENLGLLASHMAGSALLIDYILTVSVSVTAGVAAITSTGIVSHHDAVKLCIIFIVILMLVNLRGVKESGKAFAFPAYAFLFAMGALILVGLWKLFTGAVIVTHPVTALGHSADTMTKLAYLLVFLKAFSHGCAGLTGIEAVSNGVKAFKTPAPQRANTTMMIMGTLLAGIFIGITFLAFGFHVLPKEGETIMSQVARTVFGGSTFMYYFIQTTTMVMLILAANTSFAGFPRISNLIANDGYLPRQLMNMGERLVFNNGILILGILAMLLVILYHGDTHALIPLYAVGVFISFTTSQSGMVRYHLRNRTAGYQWRIVINAFGALVTGLVTIILAIEKFTEGAWLVFVAMPMIIVLFRTIKNHYIAVAKQLALPASGNYCPVGVEHTVLVLVSSLNKGTLPALQYAQSISKNVEAVHVRISPEGTERLKKAWASWGCNVTLTILESPYRSVTQPVLDYIDEVESRYSHDIVTVVVPEFVTKKWWHNLLHNQSAIVIKALLRHKRGTIVTTVRCYLDE